MVKSNARRRPFARASRRPFMRGISRRTARSSLRRFAGCRRGPDDLGQALTAFSRAIRAHRRLGRLAPEFFDSTEVNRLRQRRKEDAAWRAIWEPALESVYGPDSVAASPDPGHPQKPKCSRTRRAVEQELASLDFWMSAGSLGAV